MSLLSAKRGRLGAVVLLGGCLGCLVDPDAPCGDSLEVDANGACACPVGSVLDDGRCSPCGEHEQVRGGACECVEGYARLSSGASCTPADTGSVELGGRCTASRDCAGEALCDVHGDGLCVAPPSGYEQSCSGSADCAGTEATFCDSFSSRTCQVQGCGAAAGRCPGDLVCCEFGVIDVSLCVSADALEDGACPAPGVLVPRAEAP